MIEVKDICIEYSGKSVLSNINFKLNEGEILGLVGHNGAGKSTMFKGILNFVPLKSGKIVFNNNIISDNIYNEIGYLPEERGLDLKSTVQDQIIYFSELKGCKRADILPEIDTWLNLLDVKGKKKDKIKSLSKGNQQKIQLICTFIHNPKFIILDEPFSGLDPTNIKNLKEIILKLKENGTAIIFSSHNMDSIEDVCDKILMIKNGNTVLNGSVTSIRESYGRKNILIESKNNILYLNSIQGVTKIDNIGNDKWLININDESVGEEVFKELFLHEGHVNLFSQEPPTLYEIFNLEMGGGKYE